MTSKLRHTRSRGSTLIESLMASVVFLMGLASALQAINVASQQNASANRMVRAASEANRLRTALWIRGWNDVQTNVFAGGNCSADTEVLALAGELEGLNPPCVVDLDNVAGLSESLTPGYDAGPDKEIFRRVLVKLPENYGAADQIAVVISWNEIAGRHFHQQVTALYDPDLNETGVEL